MWNLGCSITKTLAEMWICHFLDMEGTGFHRKISTLGYDGKCF